MKKLIIILILFTGSLASFSQKIKEQKTDPVTGQQIKSTIAEFIYSTFNNEYVTSECIRKGDNYSLVLRITTTNTVYTVQQGKPLIIKLSNDSSLRLTVPIDFTSKIGSGIAGSFGQIKYGVTIEFKLNAHDKASLINTPIKLVRMYADNFSNDYEIKSKYKNVISKQLSLLSQ